MGTTTRTQPHTTPIARAQHAGAVEEEGPPPPWAPSSPPDTTQGILKDIAHALAAQDRRAEEEKIAEIVPALDFLHDAKNTIPKEIHVAKLLHL